MELCEKGSREGVLLIAAGGTIAAEPYKRTPAWVNVKSNAHVIKEVRQIVQEGTHSAQYEHTKQRVSDARPFYNIALRVADFSIVDSKSLTLEDIKAMADIIASSRESMVIITQGTDAMAPNA